MFLSVSSLDTVPRSDPSRRESRQHPPAWSPRGNAVVAHGSLRGNHVSTRLSSIEYRVTKVRPMGAIRSPGHLRRYARGRASPSDRTRARAASGV